MPKTFSDLARAWQRLGLRLGPRQGIRSLAIGIAAGLAFGVWMALADAFPFRAVAPAAERDFVAATGTLERIARLAPLAVLDEVEFRLLLMSAIVWFLTVALAASPRGRDHRIWAAIVIVAVLYGALHPAPLAAAGAMILVREAMLPVAAGVLWGWLFWRHGLMAAVAGHLGAHLSLQPLLGWFFS